MQPKLGPNILYCERTSDPERPSPFDSPHWVSARLFLRKSKNLRQAAESAAMPAIKLISDIVRNRDAVPEPVEPRHRTDGVEQP